MKKDKYKAPAGTIAIIIIYLLILTALWGSAYLTLLSRGMTQ
jgi:hypothetical protein